MSMVQPALVIAVFPSGVVKLFSVDSEGQVVRWPEPSSISQSRQNSAAPFMTGYAVVRRNSLSPPNA